MELNKLEELSLEYLSSQIDPIDYLLLYSKIFEENDLKYDKLSVKLWLRLYSNRNVVIIINEEFNEFIRSNYPIKSKRFTKNLYDVDVTLVDEDDLDKYVGSTKLLCSNGFRLRSLNLILYEHVIKSNERFRLLMSIASKRYSGYWQSDLVHDLKISPKDLFSLLVCLCKLGLVYKLTIPQNRIYKYLINNINENVEIKYDTNEDLQDNDKESSNKVKTSASICFFHKYFVIDKLSDYIKTLCFSDLTKNCESIMIEMLENAENNVVLERDWRRTYFKIAVGEIRLMNINIDNHLISRSYISFKKSLEAKNKITLMFAWCPQTNKYERSILLLKNQKDNILKLKGTNRIQVINVKQEETRIDDSDDEPSECAEFDLNGHSIQEYLYYIIKQCRDGITVKEINKHIAIKYKILTKILLNMESIGILRKETDRDGKIFMYRYYTTDARRCEVKREALTPDDSCRSIYTHYDEVDVKVDLPNSSTPDHLNAYSLQPKTTSYDQFVQSQKIKYYDESVYLNEFDLLFNSAELPRQINTSLFKRRMVLMNSYLNHFKAATFTNISNFYSDMENSVTKVDRKTVMRVSAVVLNMLKHFKKMRCDELKGANLSLTILFDSRHYQELDAYNFVRNAINEKRYLVCTHTANLKSKINDHFKNPDHLNNITHDSIEILDTSDSNMSNLNIQVPLVVTNISVNQQSTDTIDNTFAFSQRRLSLNGYVYPIMTRVKLLHAFLIENFKNMSFTTTQVFQKMTLENYFHLIGCGYHLSKVSKYLNETMESLPQEHLKILTNKRRDPINILNNQLNFLYRIKLLSFLSDSNIDNLQSDKLNDHDESKTDSDSSRIKTEYSKTELKWSLIRSVYLFDFNLNKPTHKYDIYSDFETYWNHFKLQVDDYINGGFDKLPESLPVNEVFVKKNWKKVLYLNSTIKSELDRVVTLWMTLCFNGLHSKSLIKLCHVPYKLTNYLSNRFNLNSTQIQSFIASKIKAYTYSTHPEDDMILNKILNNIYKGAELLWISRYVISEKLLNKIFLNILENNPHTLPDVYPNTITENKYNSPINFINPNLNVSIDKNRFDDLNMTVVDDPENANSLHNHDNLKKQSLSESTHYTDYEDILFYKENYPDIWKYIQILFNFKYNVNECKIIFDYIVNTSNINLRVLKKFRRLRSNEIMRYINRKSHTNITNTYNSATTNMGQTTLNTNVNFNLMDNQIEYLCNKVKLKCIMLTSSTQKINNDFVNTDIKDYKKILKSWYEYGWVVRSKKKSTLLKVYKLSNLSKLKLFPKYSTIYFYGKQLLSYIDLFNNNSVTNPSIYTLSSAMNPFGGLNYTESDSSTNYANSSMINNCLHLDFYSIYNIIENCNSIQFEDKWNYQPKSDQESNYYRLIDGGISKHIKSLTSNISVSVVNANISSVQEKLNGFNYSPYFFKPSIVPKLLVCEHDMTDILNPIQFSNLNSNFNIMEQTPVNNSTLAVNNSTNQSINPNNFNTLSDVLSHLVKLFDLHHNIQNLEIMFVNLIKIVKEVGSNGISHNNLIAMLENKMNNDNMDLDKSVITRESGDDKLYKILIYTAAALKFIILLPNGSTFHYLYWEHNHDMFLNVECLKSNCEVRIKSERSNSLVGNIYDTNSIPTEYYTNSQESNSSTGDTYANSQDSLINSNIARKRPEYISEILWMIYERKAFEISTNIEYFNVGIKSLLADNVDSYFKLLEATPYSPFITSDGHINTQLVGYLSLKIYSIVKEKPGITSHYIWKDLVILDECEVEIIIESLVMLKILIIKQIKLESGSNLIFSKCTNHSMTVESVYYPQETSYVLWKFKSILFTS